MVDRSRALFGILLVLGGVVFLLDAMDIIPAGRLLGNWWPLIIVAIGAYMLLGRPGSNLGGIILLVSGGVLLLATLDILDIAIWQLIIALILISGGLSLVFRGLGGGKADRSNQLNLVGVLSEQSTRSEATEFHNASLTSVLGEVKLDLRNATLHPSGAVVDTFCLLGDLKILVPRGWRVHVEGMPILGDFEDHTDHTQELPANAPEIRITGVSILADTEIKHA
jgi:predicted membrane protein